MPQYDYECDCGYKTEMIDSMLGSKVVTCPSCKNKSLYRLIGSGAGFAFSSGYKDRAGDSIHFKEPYFDTALRRSFSSAREKAEFMNAHGIVSAGDSDIKAKIEKKVHYEEKMDTRKENNMAGKKKGKGGKTGKKMC